MKNKVSVIIPAKNEGKHIGKCLKNLMIALKNWGGLYEIIVVDNDSADDTKNIAIKFNCKIVSIKGGSVANLRNIGVQYSKYDTIAFIDADCLLDKNWFNTCLPVLKHKENAIVGTPAIPDLKNATWVEKCFYMIFSGARRNSTVKWVGTSNMLIKKSVFLEIGGFDEKLKTAEDVDLCHRIKNKKICLEESIKTIHTRESKTLKELFRREMYRGQDSLKTMKKHGYPLNEVLSVFVPTIFIFLIMASIVSIFINLKYSIIFLSLSVLSSFALIIYKKAKLKNPSEFIKCGIISSVYLFARSLSTINEIIKLIKNNDVKTMAKKF